jgi:hypothetical protein
MCWLTGPRVMEEKKSPSDNYFTISRQVRAIVRDHLIQELIWTMQAPLERKNLINKYLWVGFAS